MTLKWIVGKWDEKMWTGFVRLRMRRDGRLLGEGTECSCAK
jgi:hypothetical protein